MTVYVKHLGISEGAFNLLNSFAKFLSRQKKSIEDAFKAFDGQGVGAISCEEFSYVLERICKGESNLKFSGELIDFIDKDKNGQIDFAEFSEILGIASGYTASGIHFNGRRNLMLCLQKAYDGDIDVE